MAVKPTDRVRRRRCRSGILSVAIALGCVAVTGAAQAQQQAAAGPRYLSWANRTTSTTPADVAAARLRSDIIPRRVAPSQAPSRPSMQAFAPPMPVTAGGLTPASAWIGPRVVPAYAPGSPNPVAYAATEVAAAPVPSVVSAPARPAPVAPRTDTEEAPSPVAPPIYAPATTATTAADPMAPRPDAPIFRLRAQGTAPASSPAPTTDGATTSTESAPVQQPPAQTNATGQAQARYYSVHRAAGRQPDPAVIPEPVFFDSVALDLAAPPETEAPMRDAQGRPRPVTNEDPSLP